MPQNQRNGACSRGSRDPEAESNCSLNGVCSGGSRVPEAESSCSESQRNGACSRGSRDPEAVSGCSIPQRNGASHQRGHTHELPCAAVGARSFAVEVGDTLTTLDRNQEVLIGIPEVWNVDCEVWRGSEREVGGRW